MADEHFFQKLNEITPLRQGDVLTRRGDPPYTNSASLPKWGVILTADCDLEYCKSGSIITYLAIVSAQEYVEQSWANEELEKLKTRYGKAAIRCIHEVDAKRDPHVRPLLEAELLEWVSQDGANEILDAVGLTNPTQRKLAAEAIDIFALCHQTAEQLSVPLARLRACWTRLGKKEHEHKRLIQAPLLQGQIRSDCFFIPTLPSETEIGFVVLLRDIRSINLGNVFRSRLEMTLNDSEVGMYRIGRFADFIRFSISQRLSFLFSRIGMTSDFEEESIQATDIVCDTIVAKPTSKA